MELKVSKPYSPNSLHCHKDSLDTLILIMKANEMQSQIYLIKYSKCFGQVHCPLSGVSHHCIRAVVFVILVLLASVPS